MTREEKAWDIFVRLVTADHTLRMISDGQVITASDFATIAWSAVDLFEQATPDTAEVTP